MRSLFTDIANDRKNLIYSYSLLLGGGIYNCCKFFSVYFKNCCLHFCYISRSLFVSFEKVYFKWQKLFGICTWNVYILYVIGINLCDIVAKTIHWIKSVCMKNTRFSMERNSPHRKTKYKFMMFYLSTPESEVTLCNWRLALKEEQLRWKCYNKIWY